MNASMMDIEPDAITQHILKVNMIADAEVPES